MKNLKRKIRGITLIALTVTIILLLILAGVAISLSVGNNSLWRKTKKVTQEHMKQEAREAINLKISGIQIQSYTESQKLPDLQYLADKLCEDEEMQYVIKKEKDRATLEKIDVSNVDSILTKIKKYPYEFEINGQLQLASIDGVKISSNDDKIIISKQEYELLKADIEELKEKVASNKENIESNKSDILKLQNKTTMRTINSGIHTTMLKSDEWQETESYTATEECYATICGCVGFVNNENIEYTGIQLEKNGEFLCAIGNGGKGSSTQKSLTYTIELKKGDRISLKSQQWTKSNIEIMSLLNITYFPK